MNWSVLLDEISEHLIILALGVFSLQMIFMLMQWLMMRRAEHLWYLLYLTMGAFICLKESGSVQIAYAWGESLTTAIMAGSFLSYWVFWKYLFGIGRSERIVYLIVYFTIASLAFSAGANLLACFIPGSAGAAQKIFDTISVVPRITALYLYYYCFRYKSRPLAVLMITGALGGDIISVIHQQGLFLDRMEHETGDNTSFGFILGYIVETMFFSIAIAYQTFRIYRRNQSLEVQILNVKMAALRAQMNPHFIHNCLTAINRFILNHEEDAASHYLIQFSRLIRDILNFSRSDFITLRQEFTALQLYLEMESLRFSDKFTFEIVTEPDPLPEGLLIPPLLVQPYVENAIYHGLLPKKGDRKVTVIVAVHETNMTIRVKDNGIGRKKAAENKQMDAQKHKSFGAQIVEERIQLHNEITQSLCTVEIFDLHHPDGTSAGTEVLLKLPLVVETVNSSSQGRP